MRRELLAVVNHDLHRLRPLARTLGVFLLIGIGLAVIPGVGASVSYAFVVMSTVMGVSALFPTSDEAPTWRLLGSLPVARRRFVQGNYLVGVGLVALGLVVLVALPSLVGTAGAYAPVLVVANAFVLMIPLLGTAPAACRGGLGPIAQMAPFVLVMLLLLPVAIFPDQAKSLADGVFTASPELVAAGLAVALAILLVISYTLSVKFLERRDL